MASTPIDGTYRPVVAKEDPANPGEWLFEVLRTGEPDDMAYNGGTSGAANDHHIVRGMSTWSSYLKGNSVMVSKGELNAPEQPAPVQIAAGQLLGRDASSDVKSVRLQDIQELPTSELTNFNDVADAGAGDAAAGKVLTVTSDTAGATDRFAWVAPPGSDSIEVGTTAPTTVDGSVMWMNTNSGHNELYYYDLNRSKWLSLRTIQYDFFTAASIGAGTYLDIAGDGGFTSSDTVGYTDDRDLTWCEFHCRVGGAAAGANTVAIKLSGTEQASNGVSQTISTSTQLGGHQKNFDCDAGGGVVACYVDSGTTGTNVYMSWIFRRRAS